MDFKECNLDIFFAVVQLGFAAAIASWLVHYVTVQLTKAISELTTQVVLLQQLTVELFQVLLTHDAQVRGVNPSAGKDSTEAAQIASKFYQAIDERLERIEAQISRTLDGLQRR